MTTSKLKPISSSQFPMARISYRILFTLAGTILLLDQLTKWVVERTLPFESSYYPPDRISVIENVFYIVHIGNEGAAWGLFSDFKGWLMLMAFIVLALIYFARRHFQLERSCMQIAFGALIGGILGNLIDRFRTGYVIDFIDIHLPFTVPIILPEGRWPAFNIADSAIVIGLFYYLILSLADSRSKIR